MAKIKMGSIVTDMSGKLGGHVYAKNKGGNYVRTKATPSNPQTPAQMSIRGIFASISSGWSALTDAGRESFNGFVSSYGRTDIFGDLRNPTGKALYQRLNNNLAVSDQALLSACVAPIVVPFANLVGANASVAGADFNAILDGVTTGSKVLIFATPSLSKGTKFVKNRLRLVSVSAGSVAADFDFKSEYVAKFGALTVGANIYVGVKVINANGQASPIETIKAVITA